MKKNGKNEELQSRREFFKRAAKGALPILAGAALYLVRNSKCNVKRRMYFVAHVLINKVKSKCCGIKDDKKEIARSFYGSALYY